MKFRAFVVTLAVLLACVAVANCGSDDDDRADAGASSSTSGFIQPDTGPKTDAPTGTSSGSNRFCTPQTCEDQKATCGPAGDGCGGVIQCGTCATGTCGGGGVPSQCGGPPPCQPATCAQIGSGCGPAGDGCGNKIECGNCEAPKICGGGGVSKCGGGRVLGDGGLILDDGGLCQPRTACQPGECGPVADGCGGLLTCPGCATGQTCGLTKPSFCGAPTCTKLTCPEVGANCGFAADGCGGLLDCGGPNACAAAGEICGLGGPNRCGNGQQIPDGSACANFCVDQVKNVSCAAGAKTKLTGTVYAPNGKLPIPDAIIYVPNASKTAPYGVEAFVDGTASGTCDRCTLQSLGSPLVQTRSKADGTFVLDDVPPEVDFPIVIQLGRWRRMITIPARTKCSSTALTPEQTRLPKKQAEGSNRDNIPLIAVSTGSVDALECLFLKLGVDPTQFSNPSTAPGGGNGRIRLYKDNDTPVSAGGARIDQNTPFTDQALTNNIASLNQYDAVLFSCAGGANQRSSAVDDRVREYADKGGRVFATHYNYTYINDSPVWGNTVAWDTANERTFTNTPARINTSFPKGALLAQWLAVPLDAQGVGVGALTANNPPRVNLVEARNNADLPTTNTGQYWITRHDDPQTSGAAVFHYTFNTPVGSTAENQCGRVLFSDFHVTAASTANLTFPTECGGFNPSPLTPQERVLAFFIFDLTSCIQPDVPPPPPVCVKKSCTELNIACGKSGDGCGGEQDCPACPATQVCQGNPPKCITPVCTATTCEAQGAECGVVSNGCGDSITCKPCPDGQVCGGNGPNKCGSDKCTPLTCQQQNIKCGPAGDGCGGPLDCGPCPAGETCGGGGTPNVCGAPNCKRRTCSEIGAECGPIADGCGGVVQCGMCPPGTRCGIGGQPNKCAPIPIQ